MKKIIFTLLSVLLVFGIYVIISYMKDSKIVVIDVRAPEDYSVNHITDATNINVHGADFKTELDKLDKNKTYKLYCRSGKSSEKATLIMKEMGFNNVENLGSMQDASMKLERKCENGGC